MALRARLGMNLAAGGDGHAGAKAKCAKARRQWPPAV